MKKLLREPCLWMAIVFFIMIAISMTLPPGSHACEKLTEWDGLEWGVKAEKIKAELYLADRMMHEGVGLWVDLYYRINRPIPDDMRQPVYIFLDGKLVGVLVESKSMNGFKRTLKGFGDKCNNPNAISGDYIMWYSEFSVILAFPDSGAFLFGRASGMLMIASMRAGLQEWLDKR